jgi:hypothetical protein
VADCSPPAVVAPGRNQGGGAREDGGMRACTGAQKGEAEGLTRFLKAKEERRGINGLGIGHQLPKGRRRLNSNSRGRRDGEGVTEGVIEGK